MCTHAISVQHLVGDGIAPDGFKGGLQIGGRRITNLRYADDIILIATSEGELQEANRKYDLLINVHKTKTMVISGKKCNIFVGMEKLEQVNRFPYFGSVFTDDAECEKNRSKED